MRATARRSTPPRAPPRDRRAPAQSASAASRVARSTRRAYSSFALHARSARPRRRRGARLGAGLDQPCAPRRRRRARSRRAGAARAADHEHDLAARRLRRRSARPARRRVPRTTSSWSFVSSRQTRDRPLGVERRRAPPASPPTRRGDSNATSVSSAAQQRLAARRACAAGTRRSATSRPAARWRRAPPAPRSGPGSTSTARPAATHGLHEHEARVADQRHAGVADERDDVAPARIRSTSSARARRSLCAS